LAHSGIAKAVRDNKWRALIGDENHACANCQAEGDGEGRQAELGTEVEQKGSEYAANRSGIH